MEIKNDSPWKQAPFPITGLLPHWNNMIDLFKILSETFQRPDCREYEPDLKIMRRPLLGMLLAAAIMVTTQACSSTPKLIKPGRSGVFLKKQVCITRFEDQKRFDDAYLKKPFQDQLMDALLSKCKTPAFIVPGQDAFPAELDTVPRLDSGFMDNMTIADIGRENGFNAIVTGGISDIRQKIEIDWLTGDHSYVQVAITAEIYDTQTAAKLLDKTYLQEVEVDVEKASETEKETDYFDIIAIEKVLRRIVEEMHPDICKAVSFIPWQGFIIAADDNIVTISAGKKVGLNTGTRLNIYQNDQIMTNAFGHSYRIPGRLIGELELTSVSENRSEAILVDGTGAVAGNSVSLK